jgi:hypothetical protein
MRPALQGRRRVVCPQQLRLRRKNRRERADVKQASGSCVWALDKLTADKAPLAPTTLFCVE